MPYWQESYSKLAAFSLGNVKALSPIELLWCRKGEAVGVVVPVNYVRSSLDAKGVDDIHVIANN